MIVTLTPNPAYDIYYSVKELTVGAETKARFEGRYPGGKGINTTRALKKMGVDSVAEVILGRDNADDFLKLSSEEGFVLKPFFRDGSVRENITVREETGRETRISSNFKSEDKNMAKRFFNKVGSSLSVGDIMVFSGSLPEGFSKSEAVAFLSSLNNVKKVVDSKDLTADDIAKIRPWLIKPNEEEALSFGSDYSSAARRLRELGCENVIISLGEKGAYFQGIDSFFIPAPKISAVSTVGAGDSLTAGFIKGMLSGKSELEAVRLAVASGSAACLKKGTAPPEADDILRLLGSISD